MISMLINDRSYSSLVQRMYLNQRVISALLNKNW